MSRPWPMVKLREVLTHYNEYIDVPEAKLYPKLSVKLYGKGVVLDSPANGVVLRMKRHQLAKAGQVILSEIWGKKGAIGFVPEAGEGALCTSHFFLFDVTEDRLQRGWLEAIFRSNYLEAQLGSKAFGTTGYAAVRPKDLLAVEIPLPPLNEQQRIVAKIDALTAKIEEAHRLRHEATHEVQALLESACKVAFKPKSHWSEARVGDFCETPQYGYTESATTEPVGPRFLRITDIQNGRVNWDNVPYCSCPNPQPYFLKENDILFARTGATTGKSFLIRDCPEAVFASYLIRLRVRSTVTPEYLYQYFQSPSYWTQVIEEKKGTGQPNVNGKKLANIRVPIPPLEEQRRIVEYLGGLTDKLEVLSGLQVNTTTELGALLPSILDRAFKGEL